MGEPVRPEILDRADMQGIILRGYAELPHSTFYLLNITDPGSFKQWLDERLRRHDITTGGDSRGAQARALNVAFTAIGLNKLGVPTEPLAVPVDSESAPYDGFGLEFREGLVVPHRSRFLGDVDESDPARWSWGGTNQEAARADQIDLLCLLYGETSDGVAQAWSGLAPARNVATVVYHLDVYLPADGKEHFGFTDGVSQPTIRFTKRDYDTTERADRAMHVVEAGEFILGYENANRRMPLSPAVRQDDPARARLLPRLKERSVFRRSPLDTLRDFGRNGTYLALRQLHQNVGLFRQFLRANAGDDRMNQDRLAARVIGRWPSGAPLTVWPDADPWSDNPRASPTPAELNSFGYDADDRYGHRCPIGAHIRRGNPRDSTAHVDGEIHSLRRVNFHRLLRRGRLYGDPVPSNGQQVSDADSRGLAFLCLNTDLRRQFEFVQQTWISSDKFGGLLDERDPLVGHSGQFTLQGAMGSEHACGLRRFVVVRGGSYFFLPGMRALRYLAA